MPVIQIGAQSRPIYATTIHVSMRAFEHKVSKTIHQYNQQFLQIPNKIASTKSIPSNLKALQSYFTKYYLIQFNNKLRSYERRKNNHIHLRKIQHKVWYTIPFFFIDWNLISQLWTQSLKNCFTIGQHFLPKDKRSLIQKNPLLFIDERVEQS